MEFMFLITYLLFAKTPKKLELWKIGIKTLNCIWKTWNLWSFGKGTHQWRVALFVNNMTLLHHDQSNARFLNWTFTTEMSSPPTQRGVSERIRRFEMPTLIDFVFRWFLLIVKRRILIFRNIQGTKVFRFGLSQRNARLTSAKVLSYA